MSGAAGALEEKKIMITAIWVNIKIMIIETIIFEFENVTHFSPKKKHFGNENLRTMRTK